MKKTLLSMACCGLFTAMFTHTALATADTPATLQISGTITNASSEGCHVDFGNVTTVDLTNSLEDMRSEGTSDSAQAKPLLIYVKGDSADGECSRLMSENQIALKFAGTPDNANGNTLANALSGDTAATGVGVEIFHLSHVVPVNSQVELTNAGSTGNMAIDLQLVKLNGQTAKEGRIQSNLTVEVVRL